MMAGMSTEVQVKRLHHVLLWPLRLMPTDGSPAAPRRPWELLAGSPWQEVVDEYTGDASCFHERHYQEFVTFLPYVQRVLYGEGRSGRQANTSSEDTFGGSGIKVFRRHDIRALRAQLRPGEAPLRLDVIHVDLNFFVDVDVVLLNVELSAEDLPLTQVQELLYRLGRAYPAGWDAQGLPLHCLANAEFLGEGDAVLARSDAMDRERFLAHVQAHRAPRIAAHWAFLLRPLLSEQADEAGRLRYRQIDNYRMPVMAYLALDDPGRLGRADFIRLGLVAGAGDNSEDRSGLPYSEQHLHDFEQRYCYDRFWATGGTAPQTRYLCSGQAMVVLGRADAEFYACRDRGVLAQFRHQHALIFMLAHFQKAALLMFSDRLVEALRRLDVQDADSVRRFKRAIRSCFEGFLRFTHRYWFHEVAEQAQARALFSLCSKHLETDALFTEVKTRISDMNSYLETDSLRRQANTVVRLTVVTILGMVGTITTGFLGMNLLAEADAPLLNRIVWFSVTMVITIGMTVYTMAKSKRLSDFLDALSDERLSARQKLMAFGAVWRKPSQ